MKTTPVEPAVSFAAETLARNAAIALQIYRREHPRSRATGPWTWYGSTGCRRIATCVFCRRQIATCSAKWPTTKQFWRLAADHSQACAQSYLSDWLSDNTAQE